ASVGARVRDPALDVGDGPCRHGLQQREYGGQRGNAGRKLGHVGSFTDMANGSVFKGIPFQLKRSLKRPSQDALSIPCACRLSCAEPVPTSAGIGGQARRSRAAPPPLKRVTSG